MAQFHFAQNLSVEPVEVIVAMRFGDGTIVSFAGQAEGVDMRPKAEDSAAMSFTDPPSFARDPGDFSRKFTMIIDWLPNFTRGFHRNHHFAWEDVPKRRAIAEVQKEIEE